MDRRFHFALAAVLSALIIGVVSVNLVAARPASAGVPPSEQGQAKQPLQPLESVLDEDGTLDLQAGFSGSLDPKGWRMVSTPGDKPRFVRETPDSQDAPVGALLAAPSEGDENWDRGFAPFGPGGYVRAVAVSGTDVYVGGWFPALGRLRANSIARWDTITNRWHTLGSGSNSGLYDGEVLAIAVSGTDVYVGGNFRSAGGKRARNIARWDTTTQQWHPLGDSPYYGTSGRVYAVTVSGSDVYIGGHFTSAGGVPANNIARWNTATQQWHPLGSGVSNPSDYTDVYAIAINGDDVYVGGTFTMAGNLSANCIARWNTTTQQWYPLGGGIVDPSRQPPSVKALAIVGTDVYVGGWFIRAGGKSANYIARWDTTTNSWYQIGDGVTGWHNTSVQAMIVSGTDVYVSGEFLVAGAVSANHIARLDTTTGQWHPLGNGSDIGMNNPILAMAFDGSNLYVGGEFTLTTAGAVTNHVARWEVSTGRWHPLDSGPGSYSGVSDFVSAIAVNGTDVYVGGEFTTAGGVAAGRIARWDSIANRWYPLGSGVRMVSEEWNTYVSAIAVSGADVYVGGYFSMAGDVSARNIARWDTTTQQWHPLGSSVNNTVSAITVSGTDVYVGGSFTRAGDVTANYIAKWDTTTNQWSPLGTGVAADYPSVSAIAVSGADVYVGGYFTSAGGVSANSIARWDTTTQQWHPLGLGVSGSNYSSVYTIAAGGTDVYVGGHFTSAGGVRVNGIARWDTTTAQWNSLSGGVAFVGEPRVGDIEIGSSGVFVVGGFTSAGGVSANSIARWDPSTSRWYPLGSGLVGGAVTIASSSNHIYVGGNFDIAGNNPSFNFGVWHEPCPISFTDVQPSDYFYDAVRYLYCRGAVSGYGDNTFRPYNSTTRGQLSKIVVLAEGWPIENPSQPHFIDVPDGHPFYRFVETAYFHGVISGYSDGTFRPDNNVTRAQLCKIVVLAEQWEINTQGGPHFIDVPTGSTFYPYIETAYNRQIISGYGCGTGCLEFRPGNNATRGQIAKIVHSTVTTP